MSENKDSFPIGMESAIGAHGHGETATDCDRFKRDHPEMLKMAEEHLTETERLAKEIAALRALALEAVEIAVYALTYTQLPEARPSTKLHHDGVRLAEIRKLLEGEK